MTAKVKGSVRFARRVMSVGASESLLQTRQLAGCHFAPEKAC